MCVSPGSKCRRAVLERLRVLLIFDGLAELIDPDTILEDVLTNTPEATE